ncbi:YqgE/AlgH family protein [Niabella beijingensis]|uniref:YqgE/AlgH family protein n=1 Tax=Niabella beijingensis TaxID=2872700 RepID=UPI001CBAED30|nr:YqgE/AlgH family protein [Niabella beijingensis]MBZ4190665.1 YqgE/AlgH family protein [Niabella beijingensis]
MEPANGTFLIANPHLNDPNFVRTVVFLCEHDAAGSVGFVMNRKTIHTLGDLVPDLEGHDFPVYEGGPVGLDNLYFLHQYPEEIPGGKEVLNGVYWGGDFDTLAAQLSAGRIDPGKVRFFLGYSGWGEGQLDFEMEEKTWIVARATPEFLFSNDEKELWKNILNHMGGDYKLIVNAPIDPRLN